MRYNQRVTTSVGVTRNMRAPSTSLATGGDSADSPRSPNTAAARSCGAPGAATPLPCRRSSTSSASASRPSARSRYTWPAATSGPSQTPCPDAEICLTPSTSCVSPSARWTRSAATRWNAARALPHPRGQADQGHPLVAAQSARQAYDRSARAAPPGPAGQQAALPRVPTQRRASAALRLLYPLEDPVLAPQHLGAWLDWASRSKLGPFVMLARTIRRHRNGILHAVHLGLNKRPAGKTKQPHPPDQPPQLRVSLSHPPHRPRLSLRHPHLPPRMTFTPKPKRRLLDLVPGVERRGDRGLTGRVSISIERC